MLVFGDVSPMTTTTLSSFHRLCVKLSQEFTVKTNINDCCKEVLQHHRSQRWFLNADIHSKHPKNDSKKLLGICLKKVKQKLPSHFQKFAHSSQRKRSLSSTALGLVFWYPQLDLPSLARRSSSSMVQLGAVSVASLIEMSMTLDQIHL